MILQELVRYYDRAGDLAPEGWEWKRIPYVIEIRADGTFVQLSSLRHGPKSGDVTPSLVPKSENRQGTRAYEKPNLLWDHYGFVLGHSKSQDAKDIRTAALQHQHFRQRIAGLITQGLDDIGLSAVLRFLDGDGPSCVLASNGWAECAKVAGCNLTFRLAGETELIVQRPAIQEAVNTPVTQGDASKSSICLVTGEPSVVQPLHFPISGVCDKPAPMASVNNGVSPAFSSFGKSQGNNFPTGLTAVFKYTTALNRLLQPGSRQKLRIGDSTAVFWAQSESDADIEDGFAALFDELPDDPTAHVGQVRALYESIRNGRFSGPAGERKFLLLGLAPNSARIVVRFWHVAPLREIAHQVQQWFSDLALKGRETDAPYPPLGQLLRAVSLQNKTDNIPPNLGGDLMRAILTGAPYPAMWLNAAVQRCRAEQRVTYLRAAAIKACLTRSHQRSPGEVPTAMLDKTNPNTAYRLGRLFAVLEKIQEEAQPGINATIRERYYGAASSTPVAVFTTLLRLHNHHLAKLSNRGRATNFEKLVAEITGGVNDFPVHLSLPDQGRFALGYYHQRQDLFTKTETTAPTVTQGD